MYKKFFDERGRYCVTEIIHIHISLKVIYDVSTVPSGGYNV